MSFFLPAGGISSLAFFTDGLQKQGIKKSQIHFASSIYGFVGILSVVIVAIPVFIFSMVDGSVNVGDWMALLSVLIVVAGVYFIYHSILEKGLFYRLLIRFGPSIEVLLKEVEQNTIDKRYLLRTIFISVCIECIGITHLYISMLALGFSPSLPAATLGYIVSVIFLIVSPFLRGIGPIEVSMAFILIRYGFSNVNAIAITVLYRLFEFWLPFVVGIFAFLFKINKLLMRVLPAMFLMLLGILNIVSVLTPSISERLIEIKSILSVELIHASNYMVLAAGFLFFVTATFMMKGLRFTWWLAVGLCVVSIFGHLAKAIDYEEAIAVFVVLIVLLLTQKEYYIKSNPKIRKVGIQAAILTMVFVLVYGIIGFYFLDTNHFNNDFSVWQSVRFTIQNYFLIGSSELIPNDAFAQKFLYSINISGALSIGFLFYTFISKFTSPGLVTSEELVLAKQILAAHGNSTLDYFKLYRDKMLFFSSKKSAFLSYCVAKNFAVVLENPVAENDYEMELCIREFDIFCYENGLRSIYYRVPEHSLGVYKKLRKKSLFLGQEGIVDVQTFSLSGGRKKSMRNALSKVVDRGYHIKIHFAPIKDGVLQKIKAVSDEWLMETGREEILFSQGMFCWEELKDQTIFTVENEEDKVVAFLNIIPDYAKNEATYDLIRKTKDAPNGVMDFILVELFKYLKEKGYSYVNLGFAPMSGITDPTTFPERSMKFAYEKIRSFSQYKGLRDYKEKMNPEWHNKYLIYSHDYDLLNIPSVLSNVIKVKR